MVSGTDRWISVGHGQFCAEVPSLQFHNFQLSISRNLRGKEIHRCIYIYMYVCFQIKTNPLKIIFQENIAKSYITISLNLIYHIFIG